MIILYNCGGDPPPTRFYSGGNRPQRGFIVGETAPNAVLYGGYREDHWIFIVPF